MQEEEKIEKLKKYIEQDKFIAIDELFGSVSNETIVKLSTDKLLSIKEHPNSANFNDVIDDYEKKMKLIITMLTVLCRYRNDKYFNIINEVVDKFINMPKNNMDGYGYIWRHVSSYPLLLVTYCLGISFLKYKNLKDLFELMNKPITQRYYNGNFVDKFQSTLIEGINSYHVFNNIDNITVDAYQYLSPIGENISKQSDIQKRLNVNNRIFHYLSEIMSQYFLNDADFSNYFDLYEFFTGLDYMDKRLLIKGSTRFAPYGRNFWIYSGSGRYFVTTDKLVHRFLDDSRDKKNDIIKFGFFGGKLERFENALKEYQSLLSRIT